MATFKICNFLILVTGILVAHSEASVPAQSVLNLNQHKSGVYVQHTDESKDGTKDGIVYLFEKITDTVGAYALIHYKQNYVVADIAKNMFLNSIRTKAEAAQKPKETVSWKAAVKVEMKNIERMVKKYVKENPEMELTITAVIVDGKTVFEAEMIPSEPKDIKKTTPLIKFGNDKFILLGSGFTLDRNQKAKAQKSLEGLKDWNEAAKTVLECGQVPKENVQNAKGAIIIALD